MDDSSSLGKVSSSTESVATVTSEEFVLVQSSAAGSPQGSEGKPRLKVRPSHGHTFTPDFSGAVSNIITLKDQKYPKLSQVKALGQI